MRKTHDCDDLLSQMTGSIMRNPCEIITCEAYESTHKIQRPKQTLTY